MMNSDVDIRAQLLELRKEFLAGLPARMELINGLWQTLKDKSWDRSTVAELHRAVHSLVGSSGTLGLQDVSAYARELEIMCKQWLGENTIPGSEEHARFQEGLTDLSDAMVAAREQPD